MKNLTVVLTQAKVTGKHVRFDAQKDNEWKATEANGSLYLPKTPELEKAKKIRVSVSVA